MKIDFDHIPPDLTARKETRSLKSAIVYLKRYKDAHEPSRSLARKITRTIRRLMRQLIDIEKFNYAVTTKWEMLTDGAWRARVLEDLGGKPALTRWDKAKAKADVTLFDPPMRDPKQIERDMAAQYVKPEDATATSRCKSIKIDHEGLFRLAPITRRYRTPTLQEQWIREEVKAWRAAFKIERSKNRAADRFRPIPVTPHELRGEATKRTGGPSWEEIREMDAKDAKAERVWFETLINSRDPGLVVEYGSAQTLPLGSSRQKLETQAASMVVKRDPSFHWDERIVKNPREGP